MTAPHLLAASSPQWQGAHSLPLRVTEKSFMQSIIDLARYAGWLVYHTHDSRQSAAGFPDLCMVRRERILFVEVKTERGRLSLAQAAWLKALRTTPLTEVAVWRPSDWPHIEQTLVGK